MPDPKMKTDIQLALDLVAILSAVFQMSDDVKNAASPLDAQGKLLRLQNSIQKNGTRVASIASVVLERRQ